MSQPSLRRLSDSTDYLVDPHVGIINYVFEQPREAGAPNFFRFVARACNTGAFCRQENFCDSGGASTDRDLALGKAIGEAVERYCAAIYEMEDLPLFSYRSAPFPCVHPSEFALYTADQYAAPGFPFVCFEESTPIRWARAKYVETGEECYVPAAMVFLPYTYFQSSGDSCIVQPISTGLACHMSYAEAAVSAICEVIERDAFTITWQAKLSRRRIRQETLKPAGADLVARFHRTGSRVFLFDITMDVGVPTILAVERGRSLNAPALTFAASTALDPEEALRRAFEELAHTARYMKHLVTSLPQDWLNVTREGIVDQVGHLSYWSSHKRAEEADFIFSSCDQIAFDDIENQATGDATRDLQVLSDKVSAIGHRVLIADVTSSDIGGIGMSVVRAIVPGFHPLFMGFQYRALGGRRLWEVPAKLGYAGITRETGDNPAPHPYP